jgi:hypothetical protein
MRIRAVLVGLLCGAGCNQVFGLEPPGGGDDDVVVDANPEDDDGDGILDQDDNCPRHANRLQGDEDGDAPINGGDACDPCPHRPAITPGAVHSDDDLDGVGDDCDPQVGARHCLRWFDGFADAEDAVVMERYVTTGGSWRVQSGILSQTDAQAVSAQAVVGDASYSGALVITSGLFDDLPVVGAYRNTVGVLAAAAGDGTGTCYGSISRNIELGMPQPANTALAHRTQLEEVVDQESPFPKGDVPLLEGDSFGVALDAAGSQTDPAVTGSLYDQGVAGLMVSAPLFCGTGSVGLRTSFAGTSFQYLVVIELAADQDAACPPRQPLP